MNLKQEKKLWKKGFKRVAGLDEAGRGPLSGPVAAAVVCLNLKFKHNRFGILNLKNWNLFRISDSRFRILLKEVRDSKKLSPKKREKLYKLLKNCPLIEWGIGRVSEKVIDKVNILEATKLAMKKAVKNLERKPDFLILDGNFKIDVNISQKSIIKGDEKVFSCAAASVIAKVYRDRIMRNYDKKYPQYGFSKHKGYPTKFHLKMLKKYGACKIHRKSFKPVKKFLKKTIRFS